jgi:hypothetical protein
VLRAVFPLRHITSMPRINMRCQNRAPCLFAISRTSAKAPSVRELAKKLQLDRLGAYAALQDHPEGRDNRGGRR